MYVVSSVLVFVFDNLSVFLQIGFNLHVGPASGLVVVASVLCCGGKVIID